MKELRTFISPVLYRKEIIKDHLDPLGKLDSPLCWFDSLLNGGIKISDELVKHNRRPLIWLVSGPPGTGKTTFLLELCYRLATHAQPKTNEILSSIFYSAESPVDAIEENMRSLGWKQNWRDTMQIVGEEALGEITSAEDFFKRLPKKLTFPHNPLQTNLIVIDSLNVLGSQMHFRADGEDAKESTKPLRLCDSPRWSGLEIVRAIERHLKGKCWIVILVQNWEHDQDHDPSFAFLADIETRLSVKMRRDYLLNYIRIVKMRFQEHARGEHLLKIYPAPGVKIHNDERKLALDHVGLDRKEGGVFILPSIHRHLSGLGLGSEEDVGSSRPTPPNRPAGIKIPVDGFNELVPLGRDSTGAAISGIPRHCCTALVGSRGAMKSHVGYLTLIKMLQDEKAASGVMLSLRDDLAAATTTLEQICIQEGIPPEIIQDFINQSRLDIVYFGPGYLPPEEFMHRVVVAIEGMIHRHGKPDGRDILCVLNGIDHLAARHPLCAEEKMFVPAMVSYLTKAFVTSIVIAANENQEEIDESVDESGLLPMAELLIKFTSLGIQEQKEGNFGAQITNVFIQRVPAGAASGASGYLFRDRDSGAVKFTREFQNRN